MLQEMHAERETAKVQPEAIPAFNGNHTVLAAILEPIDPEPIPPKVIPKVRPRCPECNVRFGVAHLPTCSKSSTQKAKAVAPKPVEPKIKMVPLPADPEPITLHDGPRDSAPAVSHSEIRDTAKSADGRVPTKVPNHELELWSMRNVRDTLAPHDDAERARIVDWALVVLGSKLSRIAAIGDHP